MVLQLISRKKLSDRISTGRRPRYYEFTYYLLDVNRGHEKHLVSQHVLGLKLGSSLHSRFYNTS